MSRLPDPQHLEGTIVREAIPEGNGERRPTTKKDDGGNVKIIETSRLKGQAHREMVALYLETLGRQRPLNGEECRSIVRKHQRNERNPSGVLYEMAKEGLLTASEGVSQKQRIPVFDGIVVRSWVDRETGYQQTWPVSPEEKKETVKRQRPAEPRLPEPTEDILPANAEPVPFPPSLLRAYGTLMAYARLGTREGGYSPSELHQALGVEAEQGGKLIYLLSKKGALRQVSGRLMSGTDPAMRRVVFRPYFDTEEGKFHTPPECEGKTNESSLPQPPDSKTPSIRSKEDLTAELERVRGVIAEKRAVATQRAAAEQKVERLRAELLAAEAELAGLPPLEGTGPLEDREKKLARVVDSYDDLKDVLFTT